MTPSTDSDSGAGTGTDSGTGTGTVRWQPRAEVDLLRDQVRGIDAWHAARRASSSPQSVSGIAERSRELRLDLARRMDVVRRQHAAIIARTEEHLRSSAHLLSSRPPPRALVVHRDTWFLDRVCRGLHERGVQVLLQLDNGADAVGVVIAEQPDLLLVQDRLPMLNGAQVLREALPYAPHTLAVAHVETDAAAAELLGAGARAAYTRRVPPAEVARALCELVRV